MSPRQGRLHPQPQADLDQRSLPTVTLDITWVRIHQTHHDPLYFNRSSDYRFNAPNSEFGVLYLAQTAHGAFIETLGHDTGIRVVSVAELEGRSIASLKPRRSLVLVDLTGAGLAKLGADNALCNGEITRFPKSGRWHSGNTPRRLMVSSTVPVMTQLNSVVLFMSAQT
jgi:hypothetical protein